ncbi:universal stress protein [Pararcticibacter amylolyticus]|uniref:Universal stress protein n=1 Tax=Pararcticibacter amylolyticus TaxID=2173175 RepID=A0A2U2PJJ1_9SPHI|nr:universal stress protein [Pararcticibacter amylolyticus]PWG81550.1 universal stress protein [Pararcticibacter amylolyticus]
MTTIIAATDYSFDGNNAVKYAAGLAAQLKAGLVLFNAYIIPVHASNTLLPAHTVEMMQEENRQHLAKFARGIADQYKISVFTEVAFGNFKDELDSVYKKYDAAMVVMGMSGRSLGQKLFGNTTTSLIASASYPVLSVPKGAAFKKIEKVLFACDCSREYQAHTQEALKQVVQQLHASVEIFNVEADTPSANQLLKLADEGLLEFKTVHGLHIVRRIRTEIKESGADLLVMVPQKYSFWESVVHVSKTGIMASQSTVPLLSVPDWN